MKICLVATVKEPAAFESFLKYHLAIGVDHIFVFLDDPQDSTIDLEKKFKSQVTFFKSTVKFRQGQLRQSRLGYSERSVEKIVFHRQTLNIETSLRIAREKKYDWIIQLDWDELLVCPTDLRSFLSKIPRDIGEIICENHEALPETMDTNNCFEDVTLFKVSTEYRKPKAGSLKARALKNYIKERGPFFTAYTQGKSIARITPDLLPAGVHFYRTPPKGTGVGLGHPLCILHYYHCGFTEFLTRFHAWKGRRADGAKKVYRHFQRLIDQGKFRELKQHYISEVQLSDKSQVNQWLRAGILKRFDGPSKLLRKK